MCGPDHKAREYFLRSSQKHFCQEQLIWKSSFVSGTVHGNGVYFARDASYSNSYANNEGDHKTMYLAQVLVGRYAKSQGHFRAPPPLENGDGLYNSVVDNLRNPSIFVIFFDDQVYPGHLITYDEV